MVYEMEYAGHTLRYFFRIPETRYYFRSLPWRAEGDDYDVWLSPEGFEHIRSIVPEYSTDSYIEYHGLIRPTANALLRWDCCIVHAASFIFKKRAWLLAAPSRTGKSTQYFNWQRLFPGEITMISGDMPVIELRPEGMWVLPSPWNGKEKIRSFQSAPLAGIVLLAQAGENRIRQLPARDAIQPLAHQLMARPQEEWQAKAVARVLDGMLRLASCWKLENLGDDASTALLRETIAKEADRLGDL